MHKYLVVFFSFFLLICKSQTWCPPGAVWSFELPGSFIFGAQGLLEYRYVSDTLINGLNCKKISGVFTGTDISRSSVNPATIYNWQNYYTRFNNKVVYVFNGTAFDTVVNYNASIGDKWLHYRIPSLIAPSPATPKYLTVEVIDTGHVNINNVFLKLIKTKMLVKDYTLDIQSPLTRTLVSEHIERLYNDAGTGFFDVFSAQEDSVNGTYCALPPELRCYKDSTFPLYTVNGAQCKIGVGLNESAYYQNKINTYPNPFTDILNVDFEQTQNSNFGEVVIFDMLGREVKRFKLSQKNELSLKDLEKSIYLLKIISSGQVIFNQKIIKE